MQHYVVLLIRICLEGNMGMTIWTIDVRVRVSYLQYWCVADFRSYIEFYYRSYRFYSNIIDYPLYHYLLLIFILRIFGLFWRLIAMFYLYAFEDHLEVIYWSRIYDRKKNVMNLYYFDVDWLIFSSLYYAIF